MVGSTPRTDLADGGSGARGEPDTFTSSLLWGRSDFDEASYWELLARTHNIRLPSWKYHPTPKLLRKWLKRLGLDTAYFCQWMGVKRIEEFAVLNPNWPLTAVVGLLLERL